MGRYTMAGLGVLGVLLGQSLSQYTECAGDRSWLSDGFCDSTTNNLACGYDGGDCCNCTCVDSALYACGENNFDCQDSACPDEDPSPYPNCTLKYDWLGDGWCDPETNTETCGFDGGDCCACTCMDDLLYPCGSNGFNCKDASCLNPATVIEYPECAGNIWALSDGSCTAENNNEECGYDGGDCCLCTCNGNACGITEFDCLDPGASDAIYDCKPPMSTPIPCAAGGHRVWVVEDTVQARALAEGVNCTGGSFEVLWKGDVVVDKTIFVSDGTFLNVTGAGLFSTVDGNSTTRLFTVLNASLNVTGVNIVNGAGTVGGAVVAARSSVTLDTVGFVGNAATGHGGAIYATDGSVVALVGHCRFSGNTAKIDGGAVFVSDTMFMAENMSVFNNTAGSDGGAIVVTQRSSLIWSRNALFDGNRAGGAGGAISIRHGSIAFWGTAATFRSNRADGSAGALALQSGSGASWVGETIFHANRAQHFGGALLVRDASHVSWNGTTIFKRNRAGFTGGAMRITNSSSMFCAGSTVVVENSGSSAGGVMISSRSIAVCTGSSTVAANTAETRGGAAVVSDHSFASFDGNTALVNNSASDGGAVYAEINSGLSFGGKTSFDANFAVDTDIPGTTQSGGALALTQSTLLLSGSTAFTRNSAGKGGAVHAEFNSSLSFGGRTSFLDNLAVSAALLVNTRSGGAIAVRFSTISLSGDSMFAENQALGPGGAVSAFGATVLLTGRSSFDNNSGRSFGGAVSLFKSVAVIDGNHAFQGNTAITGGAVDTHKSSVAWAGDAEFVNNSAFVGGGVSARDNSNIHWSGDIALLRNRAFGNGSGSGGGVSAINASTVSWSGPAVFMNNSAFIFGGAVNLWMGSTAYWSGDTTFSGCSAFYGGALLVADESNAEWSGRTQFNSNAAIISGGGVGTYWLEPGLNGRDSFLLVNGTTSFANNTAGVTGGGLGLLGKLSVTFQSPDALFFGNSAGVSGGAVFVSGFSDGPVFSAARFIANFAGTGGGAFITASGNEEISGSGIKPASATKFDGCQFVNNQATATGGAIESVAGQDYISNTTFVGNTARVGGALRLAGKVGLDNCSFTDNRSDEGEGPAIDNVGILSVVKDISFVRNVFNCEAGSYLEFNESGNAFEVACSGCAVSCQGCTFEEPLMVPICVQAMQHSTSSGGTTTLATVSINRGFWRATSTSIDVLACYRDDACLGGVTGAPDYCRTGYEGPYCSICSDRYAASFGFSCDSCSEKTGGMVFAVVLVVIVGIGGAAVASYVMSSQHEGGGRGRIGRLTRYIPVQSIKIVIVALQIVTQFTAIANITYPHVYQQFLDTVNVLNFDIGWISQLSIGCLFDVGIHGRLLIATIGPIVAVAFLGLTYAVAAHGTRGSAEAQRLIRQRHVSIVLLLTFLVYSSVSSILFQMFACDDLADGETYLRADYRVLCDSSTHRSFQVYAGLMILVYTVGIPALYTILLVQNRAVLKDEVGRQGNQSTQSFSDLWKPYKPSVDYYEVLECGRRVLLTGAVVFIYPNTSAQIAVTLMITFVFAMVSESLAPFGSRWDTWISRTGHVVVFVSVYVALLLKVDVSNERSSSEKVFETVLVATHLGMILAVIVETGVMVCLLRETVREGVSPRFRGNKFPDTRQVVANMQNTPFRQDG